MTIVDDGGVESMACGGCGGRMEAAPRWGMVDGVTRQRLHEGRRNPGGGGKKLKSKTLDNCTGHCSICKYQKILTDTDRKIPIR